MSISPTALRRVPPGAIGHNRGVVRRNYAVIPPEGVLKSRLPGWDGTTAYFLAAPSLGAGFAQLILALDPGGGTAAPITSDVQHFLYILSGTAILVLADVQHTLAPGGYAYIPPGTPFSLHNPGTVPARMLTLKKRYEAAPGLSPPPAYTGQRDDAGMTNHTGFEGRGFLHLTGFGDMRHDFEMNLMFFDPGTCFPAVETHIMEHGLYMLEGQGLYFLGDEWHEIWEGDFIWMGSFCPQQFYPVGQGRAVYLLYKNMNRDVVL
ncbi:MAG: (S)-ureidoglycine aminohydrolase [Janthinobacterium lividum]